VVKRMIKVSVVMLCIQVCAKISSCSCSSSTFSSSSSYCRVLRGANGAQRTFLRSM
jgi:hypothetical protein